MTEQIVPLFTIGFILIVVGFLITTAKKVLTGLLIMTLGWAIYLHPFWGAWLLFFQNAVSAVPTWIWVVAGVTVYFTLNHIYTTWGIYAVQHPDSLAAKILCPWPVYFQNVPGNFDPIGKGMSYIIGTWLFCISWSTAFVSYTAWIIFGGGIAKLLHLLPREPRS